MHDTITVGLPMLAILFGILLNQRAVDKLDAKIDRIEGKMESRFAQVDARIDRMQGEIDARLDRMQADLSQFYRDLGDHGARIDALEKRAS
jgi:TolA-binding protein